MKIFLSALFFLATSTLAFATTKLIPKPDWLVPASTLIVVGTVDDLKQLTGTSDIPTPGASDKTSVQVLIQIAKISISKTLLGVPPSEPIIINIDIASIHYLAADATYLFFLAPFEGKHIAYQIVEALRLRDGFIPWHSSTSASHMEPTSLDAVIQELEQYISSNSAQQGAAANP